MTGRLVVPRISLSGVTWQAAERHANQERPFNQLGAARVPPTSAPAEPVKRGDFMTPYELKLAPLPSRDGDVWASGRGG